MTDVERITPYGETGDTRHKSEQVKQMFDCIAPSYDRMNRLMSLGLDKLWRKKCVRLARDTHPRDILDLAAGTGDLTIALAKAVPGSTVTGGDLSEGMIEVGLKKINAAGLSDRVTLRVADALDLPFADDSFDVVTIAFGVRNFENLARGYAEMLRVLRRDGTLVVLELTPPSSRVVKPLYDFYTGCIIPAVGRSIAGDRRAYSYLPESIAAVPARDKMAALMTSSGFTEPRWQSLSLGVATIYTAKKP